MATRMPVSQTKPQKHEGEDAMSKSGTFIDQTDTREIQFDQWIPFLAAFTKENRGAHGRLEVVGADTDIGYRVQTENHPFDGAAADIKDRERTVWIAFGSTPENHLTHGIHNATAIRVVPAMGEAGPVLEVEAADGTRTILELTRPEDYALPPAENR
jgi:Family of unknown function (DUF5335)